MTHSRSTIEPESIHVGGTFSFRGDGQTVVYFAELESYFSHPIDDRVSRMFAVAHLNVTGGVPVRRPAEVFGVSKSKVGRWVR